jgi:hypothetical protein
MCTYQYKINYDTIGLKIAILQFAIFAIFSYPHLNKEQKRILFETIRNNYSMYLGLNKINQEVHNSIDKLLMEIEK